MAHTVGKVIFNMNPIMAIERFKNQYELVNNSVKAMANVPDKAVNFLQSATPNLNDREGFGSKVGTSCQLVRLNERQQAGSLSLRYCGFVHAHLGRPSEEKMKEILSEVHRGLMYDGYDGPVSLHF